MQSAHALAATSIAVASVVLCPRLSAGSSFATNVHDYNAGANPSPGFTDSAAALGEPTRITGVGVFPSVVSPFSPPYMPDEIVSIGAKGHLALQFDMPIADNPNNPFGIDFIVFSNNGFIDGDFPTGLNIGAFGADPFIVEVSVDGNAWTEVPPSSRDVLFPSLGFTDSGPFDTTPGNSLTDFTKPVDPAITSLDLFMLTHTEIVALYDGSGGGAGYDLAGTGLASVNYVRVRNPGNPRTTMPVEIDAIVRVTPTPSGRIADFVTSDTFAPPPDGIVDGADLAILLGAWGANPGSAADIVDSNTFQPPPDGVVDGADLAYLLGEWTS